MSNGDSPQDPSLDSNRLPGSVSKCEEKGTHQGPFRRERRICFGIPGSYLEEVCGACGARRTVPEPTWPEPPAWPEPRRWEFPNGPNCSLNSPTYPTFTPYQ